MANRLIKGYCFFAIVMVTINSCLNLSEEPSNPNTPDYIINLKWFQGGFDQTEEEMKTGFAWALSSLGATLPTGSLDSTMSLSESPSIYTVDLSKAGFSDNAMQSLATVIIAIKESEAYRTNQYVEMGRFIMLTLNSSYHYYKITEVPETLSGFKSLYQFGNRQVRVVNSGISGVQRLLEVAEADRFEAIAHLAIEGEGSFEEGTFAAKEFEVFDFMPNGQLRFGIYEKSGKLKAAADPELTRAGKPAKCLWCHEQNIQPFFTLNPVLSGDGFMSEQDFLATLDQQNLYLSEYRRALKSEVDFFNLQDHRFMEYLYIDFMEPSAERLAQEWNMDSKRVEDLLTGIPTHTQLEYNIQNVYHRNDIEHLAPFVSTNVPQAAREFSLDEPDFFVR